MRIASPSWARLIKVFIDLVIADGVRKSAERDRLSEVLWDGRWLERKARGDVEIRWVCRNWSHFFPPYITSTKWWRVKSASLLSF